MRDLFKINFCKQGIVLLFIFVFQLTLYAQDAYRLKLLGNWNNIALLNDPQIPGQIWSELTGYVDSASGNEYVIMGSVDSIYIFDVSDPEHIRLCDVESGLNHASNRDVETFRHYLYCVSDNSTPGKLQIFDLNYLPDSVHKVYESDSLGYNTHSLYINKESKRLYMCINKVDTAKKITHGMDILSLENPVAPVYLSTLVDPDQTNGCIKVHEVYIKHDTAFCSCEYKGLFVFDVTDAGNIKKLGSISPPYPYNGYNHSSYTDSLNEFIAFTDEIPAGLPVKIFRIRELGDMTYESHFTTHVGSTPHNIFWKGNKLYISWYHDGVYIFTVDTPRNPRLYAYFDTYPQNTPGEYLGYAGCWGVYPFLPSGNIAASDMSNGLFMLRYDKSVGIAKEIQPVKKWSIVPNPFSHTLEITLVSLTDHISRLVIYDLQGRRLIEKQVSLLAGENRFKLEDVYTLSSGIYFAELRNQSGSLRYKLVKE